MASFEVLNEKLTEFTAYIDNLSKLDNDKVKQHREELKLKGRTICKIKGEVKLSNDDDLIDRFSKVMTEFRYVNAIANGRAPKSKAKSISTSESHPQSEQKSQSPEPNNDDTNGNVSKIEPSSKSKTCVDGKDCNSTDPKHFYDLIHFDHPKSDEMIRKYEKFLKKQKCKKIFEQHQQNKSSDAPLESQPNSAALSNEFGSFLTDEELAQQLQAMEEMETEVDVNVNPNSITATRSKRVRKQITTLTYESDSEDDESSSDDDDDEDFDETEARRTYRKRVKNRKKEDEKRRLQEETMDAHELEKLRKERLDKLLGKTEAYMKTLTRRVRKNFKEADGDKKDQLSTNDVKDFLAGDNAQKAIEQTKSLIGGTLKDYQQVGLRWMVTLNQMRLNGILADEMGLGKTVQVLSLLAYILDNNQVRGKHLIVCPLSTLSSWRDHFEKWLPALNVYLHRGSPPERKEKLLEIHKGENDADVVISTYQMVIRDAETMSNIQWNYLIIDEAHTLKNAQGKLFEALNAFSTKHRLLLTGTPLQNNLGELWSLLNFILPSIFDSAQSFESWFCTPFQHLHKKKEDKNKIDIPMTDEERLMVMDRLHRAIDPFLLRRMKKNVLPQMVKKEEIVIKVPISGIQQSIYAQLQKYGALMYKGETKRHSFNNIMMQLRKCSNHPYLFQDDEYEITKEIYESSGKFMLLRHLIPKMKRFNHRMLIFCQFVQTMDILAEFLEFINEPYLRIDGGTDSDDRIDYLASFNDEQKHDVFLLSTRACGLGLNLYSADTVILFDSDWNPQQDLQAMARCHRIGQTREVRVFRFIADKTIEENIFDRAQKKLDLERKAIECGKFDFSISGQERKEFLEQILNERVTIDNKYESDIERKKLNQLLSRTEEEWKVFEQMDKEYKTEYGELLKDDVIPEWLDEIKTDKDVQELLPTKRKRNTKSYNEDAYFKKMIYGKDGNKNGDKENDEPETEKGKDDKDEDFDLKNENKKNTKKNKRGRKRKRDEISKAETKENVVNGDNKRRRVKK